VVAILPKITTIAAMVIDNRRARFDYELQDTFTAGMVLDGWEVKSLRAGHASLRAAWVSLRDGEAWLEKCTISRWKFSSEEQPEDRSRKLLLTKKELRKLEVACNEKGTTITPLKIFLDKGYLKCEIALVRGRKKHEKRQVLKERAEKKRADRVLKDFNAR
jgi:SsrA-binding protein